VQSREEELLCVLCSLCGFASNSFLLPVLADPTFGVHRAWVKACETNVLIRLWLLAKLGVRKSNAMLNLKDLLAMFSASFEPLLRV